MKLTITTPLEVVASADDVVSLRAEDKTGAFGILKGHADFVTVLGVSVVTWRGKDGKVHHVAVRNGVLEVRRGQEIVISTREAVRGDDLARLEVEVLERFRRQVSAEQTAHADASRLYLAALHQIYRNLRPGTNAVRIAAPDTLLKRGDA